MSRVWLKRLIPSGHFNCLAASERVVPPYEHKSLPDIEFDMEVHYQKKLTQLFWPVNYRPESEKSRFMERNFLDMLALRYFAVLLILTQQTNPKNYKSKMQRSVMFHNNLLTFCKILHIKCEPGHVTYLYQNTYQVSRLSDKQK